MKSRHTHGCCKKSHTQSGFAIILVMGLLLVAAAVTATLLARQENETVWAPIENTNDQMAAISKALAAYERKNHRLPLPAARMEEGSMVLHTEATSLMTSEYGLPKAVEETIGAGATAFAAEGGITYVSNDPTDLNSVVVIGSIPTETLGLPRSAAEDSYGRLLTYAVTLASANPYTYEASEGAITLQDNNGAEVATKLSYIVIAHGKEGAGAWSAKNRALGRDCSGTILKSGGENGEAGGTVSDESNCDENDATFIVHDVTLVAGEGYFDDQISKGEKDKVALTQSRPCPAQTLNWTVASANCSAAVPAPGLMHYSSSLAPRTISFTLDPDGGCQTCLDGVCQPASCVSTAVEGTASYECDNGEYVQKSATCVQLVCPGVVCPSEHTLNPATCACEPIGGCGFVVCAPGFELDSDTCDCVPEAASDCTTPWGEVIPVDSEVYAYTTADASSKECPAAAKHVCTSATKGGTPAFSPAMESWSTNVDPCADSASNCTTPWGTKMADGDTVTAYMNQACESKAACVSETRTCTNGTLSGSYTQQTDCRDHCPTSCSTPWGSTVANGGSVTSYGTYDSGAKGSPCDEQVHSCSYGSFDVAIGSRSQSCVCVPDEKGEGCGGGDDGIGAIEIGSDDQSCSEEGQCVDCCVPTADTECPAVSTACRCNGGARVYDASCDGGGGGGDVF